MRCGALRAGAFLYWESKRAASHAGSAAACSFGSCDGSLRWCRMHAHRGAGAPHGSHGAPRLHAPRDRARPVELRACAWTCRATAPRGKEETKHPLNDSACGGSHTSASAGAPAQAPDAGAEGGACLHAPRNRLQREGDQLPRKRGGHAARHARHHARVRAARHARRRPLQHVEQACGARAVVTARAARGAGAQL